MEMDPVHELDFCQKGMARKTLLLSQKVERAQKVQVLKHKRKEFSILTLKNEIGFTLDTLDEDHNKD